MNESIDKTEKDESKVDDKVRIKCPAHPNPEMQKLKKRL